MKITKRQLTKIVKESIDDYYEQKKSEYEEQYGPLNRRENTQSMLDNLPHWDKLKYLFGQDLASGRQAAVFMDSFQSDYRINTIEEVVNAEKRRDWRASIARTRGKDIVSIRLIFENPADDNIVSGDKAILLELLEYLHDSLKKAIKENGNHAFSSSKIYITNYPTHFSTGVKTDGPSPIIELNYIVDSEE